MREALSEGFDLILADLNYTRDTTSGEEGLDLLTRIQAIDQTLPVVAMTAWGSIELAVEATLAAEPIEAKIREAAKAGRMSVKTSEDRAAAAQVAGVISVDELALVRRAKRLADEIVRVDDFAQDLGASEMRTAAVEQGSAAVAHKAAA